MSIKGFEIGGEVHKVDFDSLDNLPFYERESTILPILEFNDVKFTSSPEAPEGFVMAVLNEYIEPSALEVNSDKYYAYLDGELICDAEGNPKPFPLNVDNAPILIFGDMNIMASPETAKENDFIIQISMDSTQPMGAIAIKSNVRTHSFKIVYDCSEPREIIPEGTKVENLAGGNNSKIFSVEAPFIVGSGAQIEGSIGGKIHEETIVISGITEMKTIEGEQGATIGNLGIMEMGEDTGENYLVAMLGGEIILAYSTNDTTITPNDDGTYNISLKILGGKDLKKIDSKFIKLDLPSIVGTKGSGEYSEIHNLGQEASGRCSYAEGNNTTASGTFSHAEGNGTTASGTSSHAEGSSTTASGTSSHAEGNSTEASGNYSHAEGSQTTASEVYSHAEGWSTTASGAASHAEGNQTTATGQYSHAEGFGTIVSSDYSHAEGRGTEANGMNSHAEGWDTIASGDCSHTEGYKITASGQYSHAEGRSTYKVEKVLSNFNNSTNEEIIEAWKSKKFSLAKGEGSHIEGKDCLGLGSYSHAEGFFTTASGTSSHAEGNSTEASGASSHAEGSSTTASGTSSHAEGSSTTASGQHSHAEGSQTTASGLYSHAEGFGTTASGAASHAEGNSTEASGVRSHAEGSGTEAIGECSHAEGSVTTASGEDSHAEGCGTIASSDASHAEGKYNIEDTENKYAHIVGNGTGQAFRSNAHTLDWDGNAWYAGSVEAVNGLIVKSSTEGSAKRFKITVDDNGTLSATEIVE